MSLEPKHNAANLSNYWYALQANSPQLFGRSNATAQINLFEEIAAIRAALLWFSQHPQFTPLFKTFSKYAVHHVLTSCFSEGTCRNCNRCFHFLGWNVGDSVGPAEICSSVLMSAYAEAIHDPVYSLQLATKGIDYISHAIEELATMPQVADHYHKQLAAYLLSLSHHDLFTPSGSNRDHNSKKVNANALEQILREGGKIYNSVTHDDQSKSFSSWLYVGIPEVLAKIKAEGIRDQERMVTVINQVYQKWLQWGIENKQSLSLASSSLISENSKNKDLTMQR